MKKGFTLIEILVVVIIVGILAGIAVPIFTKALEGNRARVAENNLRQIHTAERLWAIDHNGDYRGPFGSLAAINNRVTGLSLELSDGGASGEEVNYRYTVTVDNTVTPQEFVATATHIDGTRTLTIDQDGDFNDSG